jgi:phage repressor protein C with HTH and peptisase S24 domain
METQVPFDAEKLLMDMADAAANAAGKPRGRVEQLKKLTACLGVTYYNQIYKKAGKLTKKQLVECAKILGVPNPFESPEMQVPPGFALYHFYGEVEAGVLQEPDMTCQVERPPVFGIRDAAHPNAKPMAWVVKGDSMDKKILDGSIAFGVDFQEAGGVLHDDDIVVVEHTLDGRIERTIKAVKKVGGDIELHPLSHNPKYRPILLKNLRKADSEVRIRSLIHHSDRRQGKNT